MELTYSEICVSGPARSNNEDRVGFWQPDTADDRRDIGAIAVMADGVGGSDRGEIASAMAVQSVLDVFCSAEAATEPRKIIRQAFDCASQAIYDDSLKNPEQGQMCTTLTAAVFRHNEVTIGFVGRHPRLPGPPRQNRTTDHRSQPGWFPSQIRPDPGDRRHDQPLPFHAHAQPGKRTDLPHRFCQARSL